ncbi:low molecular weight protein-tyrosine-phosphatase [Maritalea mediterranea]|uniref:protein-tyrosine-phosphatase n=1 Tax=Maritalea mediterranea TaxID=2909667 RepID=A0ABS9EAM3_9HYPH|nr:low molecular weight protein-tyrosine-phosphatase [Maritalea mediterranea]MCF4099920.1 low molecular weight phosphotyrosine protein phosphatase [Maritalea mediterranea]
MSTFPRSILLVCLGNICRSPTAHAVLQQMALKDDISLEIDSAGTGDWHIGHTPDERAMNAAAARGYDLSALKARQVTQDDFYRFDLILAMDRSNLRNLKKLAPADASAQVELFLPYGDSTTEEVPDPYFGGEDGFDHVLNLIEDASSSILARYKE